MRRATAWVVVVGVAVFGTTGPAQAADGFWVSIASGVAGSATPSGYQEWWFETPHGPPPVAVTRLGEGTIEATTGGGSSFFSGAALPVVLHTTDGSAYLAGGSTKPSDLSAALKRQMAGGGLATATPDATATTPPDNAVLLTADINTDANGARSLTVAVTDAQSNPLGSATVALPDGGWWVVGLGPGQKETTEPIPDPPGTDPPVTTPPSTDPPVTNPPTTDPGSPVATPEPATGVLLGIGGLGAAGWRMIKRRRTK